MKKLLHRLLKTLFYTVSIFIICIAVFFSLARALTPLVNRYQDEIELWAGQLFNNPVEMSDASATWNGLEPVFQFKNVAILDAQREQALLRIGQLDVSVNLVSSLLHWRLEPSYLTITGATLSIRQQANGRYVVEGLQQKAGHHSNDINPESSVSWLLDQKRISLRDIDIYLRKNSGHSFHFDKLYLTLLNQDDWHHLVGGGSLARKIPARFSFIINIHGDPRNLEHNDIEAYVKGSNLAFWQWLTNQSWRGVTITDGLANVQLWAHWHDGKWHNANPNLDDSKFRNTYCTYY